MKKDAEYTLTEVRCYNAVACYWCDGFAFINWGSVLVDVGSIKCVIFENTT